MIFINRVNGVLHANHIQVIYQDIQINWRWIHTNLKKPHKPGADYIEGWNRVGGVMISVLVSSTVYFGFETWSCQAKDYAMGICCFKAKQAAIRKKDQYLLAWNQDNVSK
jgi:hypothetical protein